MTDLAEFLLACIAEDETWAREASRRDDSYAEGGARWQWVYTSDDHVADPDPARGEYLDLRPDDDWGDLSLRSVQEFPTMSVGPLPQFAIANVQEVLTTVAGHIARHDPARVLAECDAKRRIVERRNHLDGPTLRALAAVYADHPDWREEWKA